MSVVLVWWCCPIIEATANAANADTDVSDDSWDDKNVSWWWRLSSQWCWSINASNDCHIRFKSRNQQFWELCFRWSRAGFPVQVLPFAQWKVPTTMTNQITKQSRCLFIIIISFDDSSIVETDIRIEARAKMNLFKLQHPTAQQNAMQQNTQHYNKLNKNPHVWYICDTCLAYV